MTPDGRLQRGDRFRLGAFVYRVAMVNDCRAHCIAVVRERVEFRDVRTNATRRFIARRRHAIDIAPTSLVERVTRRT